jgi:hypothetical protein
MTDDAVSLLEQEYRRALPVNLPLRIRRAILRAVVWEFIAYPFDEFKRRVLLGDDCPPRDRPYIRYLGPKGLAELRRHLLEPDLIPSSPYGEKRERNMAIVAAWNAGGTLDVIGRQHGITKANVSRILVRAAERGEYIRKSQYHTQGAVTIGRIIR